MQIDVVQGNRVYLRHYSYNGSVVLPLGTLLAENVRIAAMGRIKILTLGSSYCTFNFFELFIHFYSPANLTIFLYLSQRFQSNILIDFVIVIYILLLSCM